MHRKLDCMNDTKQREITLRIKYLGVNWLSGSLVSGK